MIHAFPTFYGGIGEGVGAYGRGLATVTDPEYRGFEVLDAAGAAEGSGHCPASCQVIRVMEELPPVRNRPPRKRGGHIRHAHHA
jgi:hypothetical protein